MKITITEKKVNEILQRTEIEGTIKFAGPSPRNLDVRADLAKQLGVDEKLVAIRHIYVKYGGGKATFEAAAYKTTEQFEKIESKKGRIKEVAVEAEKEAVEEKKEAPAEAKTESAPAEAPAEEKKEEAKVE